MTRPRAVRVLRTIASWLALGAALLGYRGYQARPKCHDIAPGLRSCTLVAGHRPAFWFGFAAAAAVGAVLLWVVAARLAEDTRPPRLPDD